MQQIPFIDLFIDLLESALHVPGDKFAGLQEQFFTVYTAFGTMHRYRYGPVIRWASLSPETYRADLKRSIKRSINGICCILLVAYVVVLMMHGLTNIE